MRINIINQVPFRYVTAPFNNMRTLKFKARSTNAFFATVNQMFGGSSPLPTMLTELFSTIWFDYCALDNSRKLGGAAEHLIDGSEKRICRLNFKVESPHVIERRSNANATLTGWLQRRWYKDDCAGVGGWGDVHGDDGDDDDTVGMVTGKLDASHSTILFYLKNGCKSYLITFGVLTCGSSKSTNRQFTSSKYVEKTVV